MTLDETNKLFFIIGAAYPKEQAFVKAELDVVRIWQIALSDVPFDLAQAAVLSHSTTCVFPPSISDIKGWALKIHNPQLDADEAWGMVQKAIRTFHRYGKEKAKAALPPAVWETVERFGWQELCTTENIEVARGQFMKMYGIQAKREQEKAALPPAVRKLIGQIDVKRLEA